MAIYDLRNEFDREKFKARVQQLLDENAPVMLTKKHPQRSLNQNAYAHILFGYFAAETGMSAEDVKQEIFKKMCNKDIFCYRKSVVRNGKTFEFDCLRSSAALDTAEFSTALDRFRNWSASVAEIYLPAPNEEQALLHAMKVVESYKEFA